MISNKLTILLLVKGRPDFTKRWLKYANENLKNLDLIIADGSKENERYKIDKTSFSNLRIQQIDCPYDKNIEIYQKKILNSLSLVKTEYVCMMANDDFIFHHSLNNVIAFLDKNIDYSAGRGEVYDFAINSFDSIKNLYGQIYSLERAYHPIGFYEEDIISRLEEYKKCPNGLWHSVVRTKILKDTIHRAIINNISLSQIFENYVAFSIIILGKIYFDKSIYLLHQVHKQMLSTSSDFMSFEDEIKKSQKIYNNFVRAIVEIININTENYHVNLKDTIIELTQNIKRKPINKKNKKNWFIKLKQRFLRIIQKYHLIFYLLIKIKNIFYTKKTEYDNEIVAIKNFLKKEIKL